MIQIYSLVKHKFIFLLFCLVTSSSSSTYAQKKIKAKDTTFKVVGYYFLHAALLDTLHADSNYLFLDKITHLNIAFINPDSAGNFTQNLAIDTLIKKAHHKNVKVLASIAGGGDHSYYAPLLRDDKREMFISNLLSMVKKFNLDGIDVDLEGLDIGENYEIFVTELGRMLHQNNKLITAALATDDKRLISQNASNQFDFVNIMSYDRTGPWRPNEPGEHSPYSMAVEDLDYWHNERALPKEKLILGLPFYGYGFSALGAPAISMTYNDLIVQYPDLALNDSMLLPEGITMYYNNMATIKMKTELAIGKAGGVMIWQLLGDAPGEKSLLNLIHKIVMQSEKKKINK